MGLFNGLLCSVGDANGCDAVRRSQGPDGRWWRAPSLVGKDRTHGGAAASMSEEQTWGVFLYLNDKSAFDNWVTWIGEKSRPCWIMSGASCQFYGLPQWCTDTEQTAACNILPFECVAFEHLARHFKEDPATVSRKLGCDLVMGVVYGAAAGTFAFASAALSAGLPALFSILPSAVKANPLLISQLQNLQKTPLPSAQIPFNFFAPGQKIPTGLASTLHSLPLPTAPGKLCISDLAPFGLSLPAPLPGMPDSTKLCVISPTIFPPPLGSLGIPVFGPLATGYTTGYPVQQQVLVQAAVTKVPYAIHKVAVQIHLLQRLGLDNDDLKRAAALIGQVSPKNAFFAYVGEHGTNHVAEMILNRCPNRTGVQSPDRVEWIWEQTDDHSDFSYWDCIFAAKLLVDANNIEPSKVMRGMLKVQSSAVAKAFSERCNAAFTSNVKVGPVKRGADKDDFPIEFPGPFSPHDLWYQNKIFLAPCEANYSVKIKVPVGSAEIAVVGSLRYGKPFLAVSGKPDEVKEATVFLQPYEALEVVLGQSSAPKVVRSIQMTIRMRPSTFNFDLNIIACTVRRDSCGRSFVIV